MMPRRVRAAAIACVVLWPSLLSAQTAPARDRDPQPRWEIEGYGGMSLGRWSHGGKVTLPDPGAPITTSTPIYPSWNVPSWFFGDGAAFMNNVAAELGVAPRVTPLDALFKPENFNDLGYGTVGVRVRRRFRTMSLEAGAEFVPVYWELSDRLVKGLNATGSTFADTFFQVLFTGPFHPSTPGAPTVTMPTAEIVSPGTMSREMSFTVAAVVPFRRILGFESYGVLGGALVTSNGDLAKANLIANYRFTIATIAPIDERDDVTIHYRERTSFAGVFGTGLSRPLSHRFGVRVDGRMMIGPGSTVVEIDATPSFVSKTPSGYIETFTYPNLQFSNNASTGRQSTLGGPGLEAFRVFKGGWMLRGRLTAGVYLRF